MSYAQTSAENLPVIAVQDLRKYFPVKSGVLSRVSGYVKAVDGVTFDISPGETFALVGESGCGKSTIGRTILRLQSATAGKVQYKGEDVYKASFKRMRSLRKEMQIVFQDPYSALNPRLTVGAAIREILKANNLAQGQETREKAEAVLVRCGLEAYHADRYPHQFSGGQRQRVVIARALALDPSFIVADEPISALDVSIQSQILNLLEDLQDSFRLTYLFISHDLSVVRHVADRVGVMYLGKLVEVARKEEFYREQLHPYSQALISAVPVNDPTVKKKRIVLKGDVPSPANPPPGCPFHTRCAYTRQVCLAETPELKEARSGHHVACHLISSSAASTSP